MGTEINAKEYVACLIERARKAQETAYSFTQEKVDELTAALAWAAVKEENAKTIARSAVEESGLGYYEAKYIKLMKKVRGAYRDMKGKKSVGIIETIPEKGIVKIAKPVGVIGGIIPCTNPEGTPFVKAISAIKGRNAIVLAPHPRTQKTNKLIVDIMRAVLKKHGAPEDLIIAVEEVSMDISGEVMKQCDLIVATGGNPMVKAAYSSGTPALGVGVGNTVVVIDETADIRDAAKKVMLSKTFDYATSCSADNALVISETIYDGMIEALIAEGGHLASADEKAILQAAMWHKGHLNQAIVAQPAQAIAKTAGFSIPDDRTFIMVPETGYGRDYPFSGEKMSVVVTIYKYKNFPDAVALVNSITDYMGRGHSCAIHSHDDRHVMELAMNTRTSRMMVRQATSAANTGNWDNGMPFSMTLGCGTWGRNSVSENVTWRHMINTTWISTPLRYIEPKDEELFGKEIMAE